MAAVIARRQPRLFAMYGVIGIAFLVLLGQLWNVQIANGNRFRDRAETNRVRVITERPLRGVVYDRAGRQVARNVPSWTVGVVPADLPRKADDRALLFDRLARLLEMPAEEIRAIYDDAKDDPFTPARIKRSVTRDLALILEEQLTTFPGVVVSFTPIRSYPEGPLLGQVLGYTGPIPASLLQSRLDTGYERDDTLGLSGIESTFEDEMKGRRGHKQVEVDALGRVTSELSVLDPVVPGGNVVLTIDAALQRRAAELLAAALVKSKASQGVVVALDVRNSDVLAMVSLPQYDNNLFASGISVEDYKRLSEDRWRLWSTTLWPASIRLAPRSRW